MAFAFTYSFGGPQAKGGLALGPVRPAQPKGETDLPAREMLAEILLDGGHSAEALSEYETSLKTDPNRLNGLYGAARAAEAAGESGKAKEYYAQIVKNCEGNESDRPELAKA